MGLLDMFKGKTPEEKLELYQEKKNVLSMRLEREQKQGGMTNKTKQEYRSVLSKIISLEQELGIKDYR